MRNLRICSRGVTKGYVRPGGARRRGYSTGPVMEHGPEAGFLAERAAPKGAVRAKERLCNAGPRTVQRHGSRGPFHRTCEVTPMPRYANILQTVGRTPIV